MKIETFLEHYRIGENPFGAEEARNDPVFDRLIQHDLSHPEFAKVLGQVDRPGTSVVFGEKGSGKTAIRIMLDNQIARLRKKIEPDSRKPSMIKTVRGAGYSFVAPVTLTS